MANLPEEGLRRTIKGTASFKFDFVCDSSLLDEQQQVQPFQAAPVEADEPF